MKFSSSCFSGLNPSVYLEDRLDQKKHLPPNQAAGYLDLKHMVYYRLDKGVTVQISRAHGLPGMNCPHLLKGTDPDV